MYRVITFFMIVVLSGCSLHPNTQDFSRSMVADIVFHVQCEANRAIQTALNDENLFTALQDTIEADKEFRNAPEVQLSDIQKFRKHLLKTALNLNFQFIITEDNDLTSKGGVTIPIVEGAFTIGWDAGTNKQRKTDQTVKFSDTFKELTNLQCEQREPRRNYLYPVVGQVGLQDTFDNFVKIAARQRGSEMSGFSDQIIFDTLIRGSVTPSVRLVPAAGRLITANLNAAAMRNDRHFVTLTFAQVKTTAQKRAAQKLAQTIAAKAIEDELALARLKKKIPQRVQIVTHKGNEVIIPLGATTKPLPKGRAASPLSGFTTEQIDDSDPDFFEVPRASAPSESDQVEAAKRAAERDFIIQETLRIDRELLDQLER